MKPWLNTDKKQTNKWRQLRGGVNGLSVVVDDNNSVVVADVVVDVVKVGVAGFLSVVVVYTSAHYKLDDHSHQRHWLF